MSTQERRELRAFDVVVWGASGFTGRLVAEHLLHTYGIGGGLRWAIAGRNHEKLASVGAGLGDRGSEIPILLADANDASSLANMVKQTRVVCSTVGPFALYGAPLVAACADTGTHYCDITGETLWIRKMIDAHPSRARETGARIVHCCGFDSIPSDLGVWFLQRHNKAEFGQLAARVELFVVKAKGSFSGGTVASMIHIIEQLGRDPSLRAQLADPYLLNPPDLRSGPDLPDMMGVGRGEGVDTWTAPFVMAPINTRIVRRSHALTNSDVAFAYTEAVMTGPGFGGRLRASAQAAGIVAFMGALAIPPTRALLRHTILPAPGEGPNADARARGFFDLLLVGRDANGGSKVCVRVKGDRDPGYGATGRMLGESAVCLALDEDTLEVGGGSWTPSTAMGNRLLERLETNAGLTFAVETAAS